MPGDLHHDIARLYYGYYAWFPLHYRVHSMGDDELGYGKMLTTGTQQHYIPHIRLVATHLPMVVLDIRLVMDQGGTIQLFRLVCKLPIIGQVASCPHTNVITKSMGSAEHILTDTG